MDHLTERNSSLLRRVAEAEGANAAVKGQIQEFYQKLRMVQVDNSFLQQQTAVCQKQQKVSIPFGQSAWLQRRNVLPLIFQGHWAHASCRDRILGLQLN